ncbi:MAG: hypothetical protein AAGB00_04290 [Planctomycetota bacterium]
MRGKDFGEEVVVPSGAPLVRLYGGARDVMELAGAARIHLTISHCRSHATAYAVAESDG